MMRERTCPIDIIAVPSQLDPHVAAIGPTQVRKRLRERGEAGLIHGIVFVEPQEHADAPHAVALLCLRRERPRRRAAEEGDELAPPDFEHRLPPDRTIEIGALSAPLCSAQRIPPREGGR
jgi:hypothetical protein